MSVVGRLAQLLAGQASRTLFQQTQVLPAVSTCATAWLKQSPSSFHTSAPRWQEQPTATVGEGAVGEAAVTTPDEKYSHLVDKDIWDEAWAYEPRFGTEDNPIQVPALLSERIIGVTDPEDDTLVIWGIIREGEPPKQLVAGGEFFVLAKVERVEKVGDKLGIPLVPAE